LMDELKSQCIGCIGVDQTEVMILAGRKLKAADVCVTPTAVR